MDTATDHFAEARRDAEQSGLTLPERERLEALLWQLQARGVACDDERVPLYTAALLRRTGGGTVAVAARGPVQPPPGSSMEPAPDPKPSAWAGWKALLAQLRKQLGYILPAIAVLAGLLLLFPRRTVPAANDTGGIVVTPQPAPNEVYDAVPYSVSYKLWLINWWTFMLLLAIIAAAVASVFAARWWMQRRKEQLRRDSTDSRAALTGISVRTARADFFQEPEFTAALRKLRRYRSVPSDRIDVAASVRATLAHGGLPALRFARRRLSPEYVVLAEREAPHDHLPEIAAALDERLRAEGLQSARYEFTGDPNRLRFASGTGAAQAESLETVLARHEGAHLLVLMESFDAVPAGNPAPRWVAQCLGSTVPWLIDPRGREAWSHTEADLDALGVAVVTADTSGMADLADRTDRAGDHAVTSGVTGGGGRPDLAAFLAEHRDLLLSPVRPEDAQVSNLIANLGRALDREAFDWLCALALFPMVHSGFTLFAGWTLFDAPILTHQRYLALARLPWLRAAYMPDWLRRALVIEMSPPQLARAAATAAAFLDPSRGAADTREDLIHLRRRAAAKRTQRTLARRIRANRHPVFHDQLLLDALDGKAPDQLGVAVRPTLMARSATLWQRPEPWAIAGVLVASTYVLTRDTAWRKDGFAIPATVTETRIRQVKRETLPPTPPSTSPEKPVTPPATPSKPPATNPPDLNNPILVFHIAQAAQRTDAASVARAISGEQLGGRPISVAKQIQVVANSPASNQIRCFDTASCAQGATLRALMAANGFSASVVEFRSSDLKPGTTVRSQQFEVWYGRNYAAPGGSKAPPRQTLPVTGTTPSVASPVKQRPSKSPAGQSWPNAPPSIARPSDQSTTQSVTLPAPKPSDQTRSPRIESITIACNRQGSLREEDRAALEKFVLVRGLWRYRIEASAKNDIDSVTACGKETLQYFESLSGEAPAGFDLESTDPEIGVGVLRISRILLTAPMAN